MFGTYLYVLVDDWSVRHTVNRIMNLHAPEWSGEVRSVTYSPDGNTVTVAYRVTLYGTDAEVSPSSLPYMFDVLSNL